MHTLLFTLIFCFLFISPVYSDCFADCISHIQEYLQCSSIECACQDTLFVTLTVACVSDLCNQPELEDEAQAVCDGRTQAPDVPPPTTEPPPPQTTNSDRPTSTSPSSNTPAANAELPETTPPTGGPESPSSEPSNTPEQSSSRSSSVPPRTTASTTAFGDPVPTVFVAPRDERIGYFPGNVWINEATGSACPDGSRTSSAVGAGFSFKFSGVAIWLYTMPSSDSGNFSISLDGQLVTVDDFDGNGTFGECGTRTSFQRDNLPDGDHTLSVKIQGPSAANNSSGLSRMHFTGLSYAGAGAVGTTPEVAVAAERDLRPIIGGVVGGVAGLLTLAVVVGWFVCRRLRRRQSRFQEHEVPITFPSGQSVRDTYWVTETPPTFDPFSGSPYGDSAPPSYTGNSHAHSIFERPQSRYTVPGHPPQEGLDNSSEWLPPVRVVREKGHRYV